MPSIRMEQGILSRSNMNRRMFSVLFVLACSNLVLFLVCSVPLINKPGTGPEGIGNAIVAFVSVFFSALLAAFGLNTFYAELRHGTVTWQTVLATSLAAIPLLVFLLFGVLHIHRKSIS
jgi:hypothetical protein